MDRGESLPRLSGSINLEQLPRNELFKKVRYVADALPKLKIWGLRVSSIGWRCGAQLFGLYIEIINQISIWIVDLREKLRNKQID